MKFRLYHKVSSISFVIILCFTSIHAQDIEQALDNIKETKFEVSGFININGNYYQSNNALRSIPLGARINSFLNLNILGVSVPLSASFGTGGRVFNYQLPAYSFIGISPKYKALTIHVGDRNLDFNKYTFNRHSFRGLGFEYKPKKWKLSGFYGRLRRAKEEDLVSNHQLDPLFRRVGWGISGGYDTSKDKAIISLFDSKDIANSIPEIDSTFDVSPGENTIISFEGKKKLTEAISVATLISYSGITENTNETIALNTNSLQRFGGLLSTNLSTRWNLAFNVEAGVKTNFGKIVAGYERIDPGYKTFGSLFFQDDLQQIFGGLNTRFFKKKLILNTRIGFRNNNLKGDQANTYNRIIGSINAIYNQSEKLSLSLNYSSFNNVNKKGIVLDPISPILFTTYVLDNKNLGASSQYYLTKSKEKNSSIRLNIDFSNGQAIVNDEVDVDNELRSATTNLLFNTQNDQTNWNLSVYQRSRWSSLGQSDIRLHSLGSNVSKIINQEKTQIGLSGIFSISTTESLNLERSFQVYNIGLNLNHKFTKKLILGANTFYLISRGIENNQSDMQELRATANLKLMF